MNVQTPESEEDGMKENGMLCSGYINTCSAFYFSHVSREIPLGDDVIHCPINTAFLYY